MSKVITNAVFESDARKVHGSLYDYSLVEYKGHGVHVTIICPTHGPFSQTPTSHKSGTGCPTCAKERVGWKNAERGKRLFKMTSEDFINRATKKHIGWYSYERVIYINYYTKVEVTCPIHGSWKITPDTHLRGAGCPSCAHTSKYSTKAITWLEHISATQNIHIQHANNGGEYVIPNTRLKVDGYCAQTNTVYEFHGSKWHGDPNVFTPYEHCHPYNPTITAAELHARTILREQTIRELGYNLVVCWESDLVK